MPGEECVLSRFCRVWLSATPWTVASQAPLSMGLSRQEYWSRLPFPPPGNLPYPEMEPVSLTSPALAGGFFTATTDWEAPMRSLQRQTSLRIKEAIKIHESVDLSSPVEDGDRIALGKVWRWGGCQLKPTPHFEQDWLWQLNMVEWSVGRKCHRINAPGTAPANGGWELGDKYHISSIHLGHSPLSCEI